MSNRNPNRGRRNLWLNFQKAIRSTPGPRPVRRAMVDGKEVKLVAPSTPRGSASNPLGPRSRRRAHWVPVGS